MDRPQTHFIQPITTTRIPKCWIYTAIEMEATTQGKKTIERFRAGRVILECPSHNGHGKVLSGAETLWTAEDYWAHITSQCGKMHKTVLVTHDLTDLLQASDALRILGELGWWPHVLRVDAKAAGSDWRKDGQRLVMIDLRTWVPKSITTIAGMVDVALTFCDLSGEKLSPKALGADDKCRIVQAAWQEIAEWLRAEDMGNWRATGASMGWQAWRRRFMDHRVLVHDDAEAREAEHLSVYVGRAEAYRIGKLHKQQWFDWDMECAYARMARDHLLPFKLTATTAKPQAKTLSRPRWGRSWLYRAQVATEVPVLPWHGPDGVCWPVGTFSGVWWDVELREAQAAGADVRLERGWGYATAPVLRSWGEWVLDTLTAGAGTRSQVCRTVIKHWSRTLIGKFGSQYSNFEYWVPNWEPEVIRMSKLLKKGEPARRMLQLGPNIYVESGKVDAPDSMPAIMSYIMALCRMSLWRTMQTVGMEHIVHCDTDGFICDRVGHETMLRMEIDGWRHKGTWRRLTVYASRRLVGDLERRLPGVPTTANQTGERSFTGLVQRGFATNLATDASQGLVSVSRIWTIDGTERRRYLDRAGNTAPIRVICDVQQPAP